MKLVTYSILLLFSSLCHAWTDEQKILACTYLAFHVVDWGQTRHIAKDRSFYENNPVLPRKPSMSTVNAYFVLTPIVGYFVLDSLPSETRTWILRVAVPIEIACVGNNVKVGLKVNF